jgi:hypothetical protein
MFKRWISLLGLALLLAACGTAVVPVTVTDLTPADGATDVAVDVVLSATFDQEIDPATLDGAFTLTADGGADVAGTATLSADGLTASFTPAADLAFSTTYTAEIAGSVATTDGTTLDGAASWSFTTVAAPPPPPALTGNDYAETTVVEGTPIDLAADTSGGDGDVTFALDTGALPTGVTLDTDTGAIAGTPTETGTFTGTVVASDEGTGTVTLAFDITVGELLESVDYATYTAASNVNTAIDIASPFSGGFGTITYEVTAGALPAAFTTVDFDPGTSVYPDYTPDTYEVTLGADGSITGATGAVGTFTGTVTATDELGQEATATFELVLGYDLAYTGDLTIPVPGLTDPGGEVVVNGDRVRVNGVPFFGLPADFPALQFTLTNVGGTGDPADFDVNTSDGTISKVASTVVDTDWVYEVTVDGDPADPEAPASDPVTITFTFTGPV